MSTMTDVSCPVNVWTLVYTAAADINVSLQVKHPGMRMRVRCDATATTGDAATAGHMVINPMDRAPFFTKSGDKVLVMPIAGSGDAPPSVAVCLWA